MTAKELKQHRKSLAMSQSGMARLLRVHRQTYTKWERGERVISAGSATAVLMLLHMKKYHPCLLGWIENC